MKLKICQKSEAIRNSRILDAIYKQKNIAGERGRLFAWSECAFAEGLMQDHLLGSVMVRILVSPK
jgi:hypothetical protein